MILLTREKLQICMDLIPDALQCLKASLHSLSHMDASLSGSQTFTWKEIIGHRFCIYILQICIGEK